MRNRPTTPPPLPAPLRLRLRALVERDGEALTARRCGVGRPQIIRSLAGVGIRAGTAALIRSALERLDSAAQ
jgi:hypothetical protein